MSPIHGRFEDSPDGATTTGFESRIMEAAHQARSGRAHGIWRSGWLLAALVMLAALTISIRSDAKLVRTGEPTTTFYAHGSAGVKVTGTTSELQVDDQGPSISVTVPLAGLRTGIALRDKHMREKYLEVEKYPSALLSVRREDLRFPADGATVTESAKGSLTLHGQTRAVSFRYAAVRQGSAHSVTGVVSVNMTDYGIERPSFVGVTIAPDVLVRVRFQVKDEP